MVSQQRHLMKKSNWHGGKGSTPRGTDQQKYADNWDKIFKKEKELFSELNHKRKGNDKKDEK